MSRLNLDIVHQISQDDYDLMANGVYTDEDDYQFPDSDRVSVDYFTQSERPNKGYAYWSKVDDTKSEVKTKT